MRVAHGIMFHHFYDCTHPKGQGAISAEQLESMILAIGRDRIINAETWMERVLNGSLSNDDICLTFDDALLCQYEVALPILDKFGIKAFWFVYSSVFDGMPERLEIYRYYRTIAFTEIQVFYDNFFDAIKQSDIADHKKITDEFKQSEYKKQYSFYTREDRLFRYYRDIVLKQKDYELIMDEMIKAAGYSLDHLRARLWMTENQVKRLNMDDHVIGLHSYSHPTRMDKLNFVDQLMEFSRNRDHLTDILGSPPRVMSHPCNYYNADTLKALSQLDVVVGFRADLAQINHRGPLEFAREDHANLLSSERP